MASKAAQRVLRSQRQFSLRLYKAILRSHQVRLPAEMRSLGNAYVREEFKLHKTAKAEHLRGFFEGWMDYLQMLNSSPEAPGQPMSPEQLNHLNAEQKKQLMKLENEISKLYAPSDSSSSTGGSGEGVVELNYDELSPELLAELEAAAASHGGQEESGHVHHEGCGHSHGNSNSSSSSPTSDHDHTHGHAVGSDAASRL